jgi:hypothetical protein
MSSQKADNVRYKIYDVSSIDDIDNAIKTDEENKDITDYDIVDILDYGTFLRVMVALYTGG